MKKYLNFFLLLFIIIQALPAEAVKRITVNPVNIASQLVLKQDSATVASTLEYYGYTHQPCQDGYTVFKHSDGSVIRFAYQNSDSKQSYPTIQVHTKSTKPQIEKILSELNYKKSGNHYEATTSKYSTYLTKCIFGPGKYVTFDRKKKQ
ncbi:MAG: hypothetical protein K2K32_07380 [Muribaculaceae bacterium]|nr:hypothetical protein [Muribaculaceae bacterium]